MENVFLILVAIVKFHRRSTLDLDLDIKFDIKFRYWILRFDFLFFDNAKALTQFN